MIRHEETIIVNELETKLIKKNNFICHFVYNPLQTAQIYHRLRLALRLALRLLVPDQK